MEWLQCYYNPEMRNVVDHDGRTMWFKVLGLGIYCQSQLNLNNIIHSHTNETRNGFRSHW